MPSPQMCRIYRHTSCQLSGQNLFCGFDSSGGSPPSSCLLLSWSERYFYSLLKRPVFILSAWVLIVVSIPFERSFPCQQGHSPPCRGCSAQITLLYFYRFYTSDFRVKSDIKYYCFRSGRREIFANYFRRVDRLHHTIVACQRRVFIALGEGVNSMSYHYHFILFFMFY